MPQSEAYLASELLEVKELITRWHPAPQCRDIFNFQLTFPFVWKKYLNKLVFLENFNIFYTDFFEKISHKKTFLIRLKTLGKKFA